MTAPVLIIAEAGVNHNGSLDLALGLVESAAASGADVVKFQTFRADKLVSTRARKARYQAANTGGDDDQLGMLRGLELSEAAHEAIVARCRDLGIAFMSTAFDSESLSLLTRFDVPAIKLASGDVTAAPLVLQAARLRRKLLLSTGMCTLSDIEEALGVIAFGLLGEQGPSKAAFAAAYASDAGQEALRAGVTLLHCSSEYPAAFADVNLRAMDTLRQAFSLPVGYSDHTPGIAVSLAAVARGATVIEKHFTLDRTLAGPDHRASLTPAELTSLVEGIRQVECALGDGVKRPTGAELRNRSVVRRGVVAAQSIRKGERFTEQSLAIKRPCEGAAPIQFWDLIGRVATRDYAPDDPVDL
jgi:N-acetylneuraminate synthase